MTKAPVPRRWAAAYQNSDYIWVLTYSGYRAALLDGAAPKHELSTGASDDDLGQAVRDALAASRFLSPVENRQFFDIRGRAVPDYESWVESVMERRKYRTRRAMFREMKYCAIEAERDWITIRPTYHDKLEGWSGEGILIEDHVRIKSGAPSDEVGGALRVAFSRCR